MIRVYILFNHTLFGQGIQSLLEGQPSIHIVGTRKYAKEDFLRDLEAQRPDVVLLEESEQEIEGSALVAILTQGGARRVVELDLNTNYATVYEWRRFENRNMDDLAKIIREGWESRQSPRQKLRARRAPARDRPRPPDIRGGQASCGGG